MTKRILYVDNYTLFFLWKKTIFFRSNESLHGDIGERAMFINMKRIKRRTGYRGREDSSAGKDYAPN